MKTVDKLVYKVHNKVRLKPASPSFVSPREVQKSFLKDPTRLGQTWKIFSTQLEFTLCSTRN